MPPPPPASPPVEAPAKDDVATRDEVAARDEVASWDEVAAKDEGPAKIEVVAKDEAPARIEVVAKPTEAPSAIELPSPNAAPPETGPDASTEGLLEDAAPSVPPPAPLPAAPPMLSLSDGGPTSSEPFPLIPTVKEVSPLSSGGRREPTSGVLQLGLAFFLVALGFGIGRITAPAPAAGGQSIAQRPPPSVETTSVTTAVMPPPAPPPLAAAPPPPSTASVPAALPSGSRDLDQANKPLATAAASALRLAAPVPTVVPDLPVARRAAAPGVRPVTSAHSEETEPTTAVAPPAPSHPVNSFVQAVHDDIAEDEETHKK